MDPFQYPIDTKTLLRKKKSLKRELSDRSRLRKRIAVLGGSTTNEIVEQLDLFLLYYGIEAEFYQSEYGQYWQDAVFGNEELDKFHPDILFIHTNWRNIMCFPEITDAVDVIDGKLQTEYLRFETMWDSLTAKFCCPIIQNNFDRPNYRLLGNMDISDVHGRSNFIVRLNQRLYTYKTEHSNFYVNDLDFLAADYGYSKWDSASYWHLYKYAMCLDAIPYVAESVAKIIKSIFGKNKKVLALDLDNTLWGGIIGDDGVEGIAIGPEVPRGQIYSEFQEYCKAQKSIGAILAVNSKNDEANALAGLNHPDGILRPNDFVSIKSNWEPKNQNLMRMADELALGIDSFVFVDDNPAERAIVGQISTVSIPTMDAVENYIKVLDHCGYFEVTSLSQEDAMKTELYHARAQAVKSQEVFTEYGEYLDSLSMTATIRRFEPIYIQRIAQLTNKSNQFNLTTLRCTEDDIRAMSGDEKCICFYGKLEDKYADNGVVAIVSAEQDGEELHIRLWAMSCRVLKRGLEDSMMNRLVAEAKTRGIKRIFGYYYPTEKNGMVRDFYQIMGFKVKSDAENLVSVMDVDEYIEREIHMSIAY